MRLVGVAAGILSAGILAFPPTSEGAELLSVAREDNLLRTIDIVDGSTVDSIPIILPGQTIFGFTGLAADPLSSDLYGLVKLEKFAAPLRFLVIVDPDTGDATLVGNTMDRLAGLAFDDSGVLYAVSGDGGAIPESLFTLSLIDGSSTFLTALGNGGQGEAIGFNPDDGMLYHASGINDGLNPDTRVFEKVDLGSFFITNIPLSGDVYSEMTALVFFDGDFLGVDNEFGVGATLMDISTGGAVGLIGPTDHVSKGIVVVPEPGVPVGLAAGCGLLLFLKRRRARSRAPRPCR
jgi:hypothetical protein